MLNEDEGRRLLRVARRALERHLAIKSRDEASAAAPIHVATGGLFATLKRAGSLRGCIGYLVASGDLVALTERAVVAAATSDPRFPRVEPDEVPELRIGLSILTPSEPVHSLEEIEIGRHGVIVERGGARGLLLPQVAAERGWDRERFLGEASLKAGLSEFAWREPGSAISRFAAELFEEEDECST